MALRNTLNVLISSLSADCWVDINSNVYTQNVTYNRYPSAVVHINGRDKLNVKFYYVARSRMEMDALNLFTLVISSFIVRFRKFIFEQSTRMEYFSPGNCHFRV